MEIGEIKIFKKIKEKKEFSRIDNKLIKTLLLRNKNYKKFLEKGKERYKKEAIKQIRALLRKIITPMPPLFYKKFNHFKNNIEKEEIIRKLINMHQSTKERSKEAYDFILKIIKKEKIKNIIDLGCGINLIAMWYYFKEYFKNISYLGFDIDGYLTDLINEFAKKNKLNAKVIHRDVSSIDWKKLKHKNRNRIILALKVLDAVEEINRGLSSKIIELKGVKLVSFSLKSLSGKRKIRERKWFEKLLKNKELPFKKITINNEIFYIIRT